jgi:hypothetical protein
MDYYKYHYSNNPELKLDDLVFDITPYPIRNKPKRGFWTSDDSWREWCEGEDFRVSRLQHVYQVEAKPQKILTIPKDIKIKDIEWFLEPFEFPEKGLMLFYSLHYFSINFEALAAAGYSALTVPDVRFNDEDVYDLFYGWDVPSTVFFDKTFTLEKIQ